MKLMASEKLQQQRDARKEREAEKVEATRELREASVSVRPLRSKKSECAFCHKRLVRGEQVAVARVPRYWGEDKPLPPPEYVICCSLDHWVEWKIMILQTIE